MKNELPLKELSIDALFNDEDATYEIPIYQRNYAWEKDEIPALVQDVYNALQKNSKTYFIGTLVSFHKGDLVYEIIDGQQRLTTIFIILKVLGCSTKNRLTYRARKKSDKTLQALAPDKWDTNIDEKDNGIIAGYKYAKDAIDEIVTAAPKESFTTYFLNSVHIIHYQVPRDIDLNHYFEIMNSRGEQLEMSEIIKARLMEKLNEADKSTFNRIWECACDMNVFIQQKFTSVSTALRQKIFGEKLEIFGIKSFDELSSSIGNENNGNTLSIKEMLDKNINDSLKPDEGQKDKFISIIDFSNFLLIVLKLTRLFDEQDFKPLDFILDDKELIHEFDKLGELDEQFVKRFSYNLLKAKYFLDNYIAHRTGDEVTMDNNPWKVERWYKDKDKKEYARNLSDDDTLELVQLLSMLEVTFTPHTRKNYLLYCLIHLFKYKDSNVNVNEYCDFLKQMVKKFFKDIYLNPQRLLNNNTPNPGSFDEVMLDESNHLTTAIENSKSDNELRNDFIKIYRDGTKEESHGIPLFVFNYLDYTIWEKYVQELRGKELKAENKDRMAFYESLGCSDFGLEIFQKFYFSRTRKSLEHFFPQHQATGKDGRLDEIQINCLGNYAMIGSDANSSGSDWFPISKLHHYRDNSGKISMVSVASLKMMIMMQICKDNENQREQNMEWLFKDIQAHQAKMLDLLFPQASSSSQLAGKSDGL